MSDPHESDQHDDAEPEQQLPDGSGPGSTTGDTGDPDQFQG